MRRRSFLRTAAAAVPAFSMHKLRAAQPLVNPETLVKAPELHLVGAGQDRLGHPHTLGYSSMAFKVMPGETGGGLFMVEHSNLVAGGPPLHKHLAQEEWFYLIEGKVAFQVGEQRIELHPGESVLAPRMVPHTFSAVGETPAHMLIAFTPAGKMEQFFHDSEGAIPTKDVAAWFSHYDMEYVGPSPFWKT